MDSVPQQSQQTGQQSAQQSSNAQLLSPIVNSIDVSQQNQNSTNDSSNNCSVSVSINGTIVSSNVSEAQNTMSSATNSSVTSMPSASVSTATSIQGSIQTANTQSPQLLVSSSQPQMVPTSQSTHLNTANGIMTQISGATITSMANQMNAQTAQHNQMQPLLQQTAGNQMSVTMSSLPQVQVIQQPMGGTAGTYQLQQVYPQTMIMPGMTIQNMPFGGNQGLSLQIPFSGTGGLTTGTMPITSIAAKPPIMSKGVAISPLTQQQHHMISSLRPGMSHQNAQILKQVLPTQQFVPHSNNQIVFSQILPQQNQHSVHQSILPANANKTLLESAKGKPFGTGSVRSQSGIKMLSHSAAIQPKSPAILPATSISSSFVANSQFKSPFPPNANTTQLIQTPSNLIANSQILGSFQTLGPGLTWATSPQSTHLVAQNGSPIFIRGPTQGGEQMFISTSNMTGPQLQAVSMSGPINVQNSVHTPIQVTTTTTQASPQTPTSLQNTSLQTISVSSSANTTPSIASINTSQVTVTPTAPTVNKTKILRQMSSAATQTATPQKVESTTNLKPIAPAKPKPSPQHLAQSVKQLSKEMNTTTVRSMSVGTTQTVSQPTPPTTQVRPQSNKSDASNQTHKVSVGTETARNQSQMPSTRVVSDQNKPSNVKSGASSETSDSKMSSISDPIKTPQKRAIVEKKDASTEQDMDLSANPFPQSNPKSVQNSVQTNLLSNNVNQPNGQQIPVLSDLNRQDFSKQPQKAIVKPQKSQILTHVIDGYIIKESANPFPVNGLSYSSDTKPLNDEKNNSIESLKIKNKNENSLNSLNSSASSSSKNRSNSERHLCLNCGAKRKSNSKNNKTHKRFCSQTCSEKFTSSAKNSANSPRLVLYNSVTGHLDDNDVLQRGGQDLIPDPITESQKQSLEEKKKIKSLKRSLNENSNDFNTTKNGDITSGNELNHQKATLIPIDVTPIVSCVAPNASTSEETTNSAIAGLYIPPGGRNPLQWTVNDVYEFVRNLQGCTEYADEFRSQEIDGQALMLIKEDHLMNTMNMKLGPALKICSKINALREDVQKQS